jgi:hypothetical protein
VSDWLMGGSWCGCGPRLKHASRTVKDSSDRVNRVQGRARKAAEARHDRCGARNAWDRRTTIEEWPAIRFRGTRVQHRAAGFAAASL